MAAGTAAGTTADPATTIWAFPLPAGSAYVDETYAYHLTLADVLALQHGESVDLTLFHRNVWDSALDTFPENVPLRAADVFARDVATYVHDHGVVGTLTHRQTGASLSPQRFRWHVEYEPGCWYPFDDDGTLRGDGDGAPRHYSTFPCTTRVGWRGPCTRTAFVALMPNVVHVVQQRRAAAPDAEAKAAALEDAEALANPPKTLWIDGCEVFRRRPKSFRQTVVVPEIAQTP
jgi:hypothetical protein